MGQAAGAVITRLATKGHRRLAARILYQAAKDVQKGNDHADDAREFLTSEWGQELAVSLGVAGLLARWLVDTTRVERKRDGQIRRLVDQGLSMTAIAELVFGHRGRRPLARVRAVMAEREAL